MSATDSGLRGEVERHISDHVERERARVGRVSRIRELVLGFQDGLLVPLGVVTGMAAANPGRAVILVAGLAEAVAGSIAMGAGSYLASEAEESFYRAEIDAEAREIDEFPEREQAELAVVLARCDPCVLGERGDRPDRLDGSFSDYKPVLADLPALRCEYGGDPRADFRARRSVAGLGVIRR